MSSKNKNLLERLLTKLVVDDVTDCWLWQGGKNNIGYGLIRDDKKMRTTHRVSYEEHNNCVINSGISVFHTCNNYNCCNPDHLRLGTRQDIADKMVANNRFFTGKRLRPYRRRQKV